MPRGCIPSTMYCMHRIDYLKKKKRFPIHYTPLPPVHTHHLQNAQPPSLLPTPDPWQKSKSPTQKKPPCPCSHAFFLNLTRIAVKKKPPLLSNEATKGWMKYHISYIREQLPAQFLFFFFFFLLFLGEAGGAGGLALALALCGDCRKKVGGKRERDYWKNRSGRAGEERVGNWREMRLPFLTFLPVYTST